MIKKTLFVLLAAFTIFSCQKKDAPSVETTQDVEFGITEVDPGLKGTDVWECPTNMEVDYAHVIIDNVDYYPLVFRLNGKLYTQAIKLPAGDYTVSQFLLMREEGVAGPTGDVIVMATPDLDAPYDDYVSKPTSFPITVGEFTKTEVDVEVLCFLSVDYDKFGFNWFGLTEIVVRELCFFGDVCLNDAPWVPEDYQYSLYDVAQLPLGTQPDMPAIFKMHVYGPDGEIPYSPFTNATVDAEYGVGAPLCVQYPDNLNVSDELFTFDLYILVKNAAGSFSYQPYYSFYATDGGALMLTDNVTPADDDANNVVEFVLGSCNLSDTDLTLDWLSPVANVAVSSSSMATSILDVFADPSVWFFYNDEIDVIDNSLGSFVTGPAGQPAGSGSAQISVTGTERRNIATYQFAGTPLADITTFAYSTYNPAGGNGGSATRSGYLNFNVEFYGTDVWQKRLAYVPSANNAYQAVQQDTWQEWDVIDGGNALWWWSGYAKGPDGISSTADDNTWPDGETDEYRTWSDLMTDFPNARVRVVDGWMGVRVGEPYSNGYTENIDAFKFGVGGTFVTYDFD